MGRTTPTVRQKIDSITYELGKMGALMNDDERLLFNNMLRLGRLHAPEINFSAVNTETGYLISIIFELFKVIRSGKGVG